MTMAIFSSRFGVFLVAAVVSVYTALFMHAESEILIGILIFLFAVVWYLAERSGVSRALAMGIQENGLYSNALFLVGLLGIAAYIHGDHFNLLMLVTVMVFVVSCIGLNIQFGYTGLLNFAGAAFFGAGGYTAAMLTTNTGIPHLLVLFIGGLVAVLIGFVITLPVLRTRGHYAAVVTIAFSLLFRTLVEVNQALGGAQGAPVAGLNLFGWDFNSNVEIGGIEISFYMNYFALALVFLVAAMFVSRAIEKSWIGLNLDTIRLDETAAACFGLNITRWKVTAFSIGNFMLGVMGAFFASMLGFIAPNNFTFGDSLIMLSIILLGGIGSVPGIMLAATIVIVLPEKLQAIQEYRFLIFALGVILILLFRPNGLIRRRTRVFRKSSAPGGINA